MNQEYFIVQLSPTINVGIPLENMGAVVQLEVDDICAVPGVSDFWYGVANFKGSLLWILDSDRYFELDSQSDITKRKMTAVILKHHVDESPRKIALVTQKIMGIVSLELSAINQLQELNTSKNSISSTLSKCCSPSEVMENQKNISTYILNPVNLLQQLHQESILISA